MLETMTPDHPRWKEFCDRLEGPEGCHFQGEHDEEGNVIAKTVTWKCAGGTDKSFATAILHEMGGIDIQSSLDYFDEHGGHCDCEILFNVNP